MQIAKKKDDEKKSTKKYDLQTDARPEYLTQASKDAHRPLSLRSSPKQLAYLKQQHMIGQALARARESPWATAIASLKRVPLSAYMTWPRSMNESSRAWGAAADSNNFLSSEHEELAQHLTRNMTSKAFVRATRPMSSACCGSANTKTRKCRTNRELVSNRQLAPHLRSSTGQKKRLLFLAQKVKPLPHYRGMT